MPIFDCDGDDSMTSLLVTATEAVPTNDWDDSKVTLLGAVKEAVRLFDCDDDSCDRFALDEVYPVLTGMWEEFNTVKGPEEGEEIAPAKGTMSDAAQRRV